MQALLSLSAAADHALALADVLGRRQAASLTLCRATLEAAAWAAHLADASVETEERARRYINEILYAISEQGRSLAGYGKAADAAEQRERIETIIEAAKAFPAWGSAKTVSDDWRVAATLGKPRPSVMNLIDALLATPDGQRFGTWVYRATSAVSHTSPHGFEIAGAVTSSPNGDFQVAKPTPWTSAEWATLNLPAVGGLYNAALRVFARMDWDAGSLRTTAGVAIGHWLDAAHPGSSADFKP